jgi:hypothetical protein
MSAAPWAAASGATWTNGYDEFLYCHVTIEMPLRTAEQGKISTDWAANKSAELANDASDAVWPTPFPQQKFCDDFRKELGRLFGQIKGLGARVEK